MRQKTSNVFLGDMTYNWQGKTGLKGARLFTVMITRDMEVLNKFSHCTDVRLWKGDITGANRPLSIYQNSAWQWGLEDTNKGNWITMIILNVLNTVSRNKNAAKLLSIFDALSLENTITSPTRVTPSCESLIDLIVTSKKELIHSSDVFWSQLNSRFYSAVTKTASRKNNQN